MAKDTLNTEGKENINAEFMDGFGIESTDVLDSKDLANFLDSDESINGNPDDITPADDADDDTPPPPARKQTRKNQQDDDNQPDNRKSKEQIAAEKAAAREKDLEDRQKQLNDMLDDDDDDTPPPGGKAKPNKTTNAAPDDADDEPDVDEALQENLAVVAKEFYKLGLFTKDSDDEDEEIRDPEKFVEKAQNTFKKGTHAYLDNLLGHFSPKNKELFYATYAKGVDPETYLAQLNKIESYEKMDLKQEANQEHVVTQALRNQGWEEEDIKDQVAKLKSYSELEDTALKYHKGLVKSEKAAAKELEAQAQREEQRKAQIDEEYDNNLRSTFTEKLKEKEFDGLPVTDKAVEKAYDFAYNKKWELNGALLTDFDRFILDLKKPENHAVKAKLALLFAQDYDPNKPIQVDFSKIQKKAASKESKTLFHDLASKAKSGTKGRSAYQNVTKSFFDSE